MIEKFSLAAIPEEKWHVLLSQEKARLLPLADQLSEDDLADLLIARIEDTCSYNNLGYTGFMPEYLFRNIPRIPSFRATLTKKFGNITADDFINFSTILYSLCIKIFQQLAAQTKVDGITRITEYSPENSAFLYRYSSIKDDLLTAHNHTLDRKTINEINTKNLNLCFRVAPLINTDDPYAIDKKEGSSYAQIEWTKDFSKQLFFSAYQNFNVQEASASLCGLLYDQLFNIPDYLPGRSFILRYGIEEDLATLGTTGMREMRDGDGPRRG